MELGQEAVFKDSTNKRSKVFCPFKDITDCEGAVVIVIIILLHLFTDTGAQSDFQNCQKSSHHAGASNGVVEFKWCAFTSQAVKAAGSASQWQSRCMQFCANQLLAQLGQPKLHHIDNPFHFMDTVSLQGESNFFEK